MDNDPTDLGASRQGTGAGAVVMISFKKNSAAAEEFEWWFLGCQFHFDYYVPLVLPSVYLLLSKC